MRMETINRIEKMMLAAGVGKRQIRRELADMCGITPQSVGDWFNGSTKKISPDYIAIIADRLGTTSDYLITGKELPYPESAEDFMLRYGNLISKMDQRELFRLIRKLDKELEQRLDDD